MRIALEQPLDRCPGRPQTRGWLTQRPQREAEQAARRRAVAFGHWAGSVGVKHIAAAGALRLAPGTLAFWEHRQRYDDLAARPLGRPCDHGTRQMRNAALGFMRIVGFDVTVAAVQRAFPALACREVQNLHARFRWDCCQERQRLLYVLHWHHPGAVWAMDHVGPLTPIDGRWPYVFSVRDLASGCQLAWLPVLDESAAAVTAALQRLFLEHGPPLVLKSDNGSGFTADETRRFLDGWQVLPLLSPPYTPEYNGACEAGNGSLKTHTNERAAQADPIGQWTAEDCEAARCMANELNYPQRLHRSTPLAVFAGRTSISPDTRAAFRLTVERERVEERTAQKLPLETDLGHAAQAAIDRVAIRRALVEHGTLTFTRRRITPPIQSRIPLKVS
jgi:hypothetical protein